MPQWESPYHRVWMYGAESFSLWLRDEQSRFVLNGHSQRVDYTGTASHVLEAASDMAAELRERAAASGEADEFRKTADELERAVASAPGGIR